MTSRNPLSTTHVTPSDEQAERLGYCRTPAYTVEVRPPRHEQLPNTLTGFVRAITELRTAWLGLRNTSPTMAFEIRRPTPDRVRLQFAVPTKRLERKLRTHLTNEIRDVEFDDGTDGLPVSGGESIGGGLLSTGRRDWSPLRTEFDSPPTNSLIATLHRHAMRDTGIVIQLLFRPVAGRPLRRWWWRRRAYQRIDYLRTENEKLWGSRSPTRQDKRRAAAIERKVGATRFVVSIRLVVIGAEEYTPSRVMELAGGFNVYQHPGTGQYLDATTVSPVRSSQLLDFCKTVADRRFGSWRRGFQVSVDELAALVSLPDRNQQNLKYAEQ